MARRQSWKRANQLETLDSHLMKNVNEINKRSGAVWILTCLAIALAIGGSASSVLGQGSPPPLTANADGLIAGEAEDYDAIFEGSLGPHNWELFSDIEGFQGTGFMRAMPDGGASTGAAGDLTGEQGGVSPRMDYQVDFPAGGT